VSTDAASEFIISQPGSYYLTGNLAVTKTNGIVIQSPGVHLDLSGFEIKKTTGSGGAGILLGIATATGAVISHGTVSGSFYMGIDASTNSVPDGRADRLIFTALVSNPGGNDGAIRAANGWHLSDCTAYLLGAGVPAFDCDEQTCIERCTARHCQWSFWCGNNSTVRDCHATDGTWYGILTGDKSLISGCVVDSATGFGISSGSNTMVINCNVSGTKKDAEGFGSGDGIFLESYSKAVNCISSGNLQHGIVSNAQWTVVKDCSCYSNTGSGIQSWTDNTVIGNKLCNNKTGITVPDGARNAILDGNHIQLSGAAAGTGIEVAANVRALIVRNVVKTESGTAYSIGAGNRYGAIVDTRATAGLAAVSGFAAAGNLTTTDPFANFSQ
jgi:hypothetical protein